MDAKESIRTIIRTNPYLIIATRRLLRNGALPTEIKRLALGNDLYPHIAEVLEKIASYWLSE